MLYPQGTILTSLLSWFRAVRKISKRSEKTSTQKIWANGRTRLPNYLMV